MDETRLEELYFEYDPDKDCNGEVGIVRAEIIFKRCRYNLHKLKKWIMIHRLSHLEKDSFERNVSYKI